jgi:hypothetical protein
MAEAVRNLCARNNTFQCSLKFRSQRKWETPVKVELLEVGKNSSPGAKCNLWLFCKESFIGKHLSLVMYAPTMVELFWERPFDLQSHEYLLCGS